MAAVDLEEKRQFTAAQRRKAPTLPGSEDRLPIEKPIDVTAAVRSIGRVKEEDRARAKRWIMRRARELGCMDRIPDAWKTESKGKEPMVGHGVMVALYPPREVAEKIAIPGGSDPADLHVTLGYLGEADDLPDGGVLDLIDLVRAATEGQPALAGSIGGIGEFPPGPDGKPVYVPVDVPGLSKLRERIAAVLGLGGLPPYADHGFTPHMTLGYGVTAKPVKPVDVAFDQVWVVAGGEKVAVPLGGGNDEGKAMTYDPSLETGDFAGTVEAKHMDRLDGTYEDRIRAVRDAVQVVLRPAEIANPEPGSLSSSYYVSIVGTYPDRMIVTRSALSNGIEREETFEVPYTWDDGSVSLGAPREVRLQVDVEPVDGGSMDEVIANPAMDALGDAAYAVRMLGKSLETKAGRVLSGANESRLRAAVEHLISVLEAAGVRIGEHADDRPPVPASNATTPDTTSPTVLGGKDLPHPAAYTAELRALAAAGAE